MSIIPFDGNRQIDGGNTHRVFIVVDGAIANDEATATFLIRALWQLSAVRDEDNISL